MDTKKARKIAKHSAKIAELAAMFCAKFGSSYQISEDSPRAAWETYEKLMSQQVKIAGLLDNAALVKPYIRWEPWWERRDVINLALVNHLASESIHLVERVAYQEAVNEDGNNRDSLHGIQQTIAGLLHPLTRQQVINHGAYGLRKAI